MLPHAGVIVLTALPRWASNLPRFIPLVIHSDRNGSAFVTGMVADWYGSAFWGWAVGRHYCSAQLCRRLEERCAMAYAAYTTCWNWQHCESRIRGVGGSSSQHQYPDDYGTARIRGRAGALRTGLRRYRELPRRNRRPDLQRSYASERRWYRGSEGMRNDRSCHSTNLY